jgi:hypothetical protein
LWDRTESEGANRVLTVSRNSLTAPEPRLHYAGYSGISAGNLDATEVYLVVWGTYQKKHPSTRKAERLQKVLTVRPRSRIYMWLAYVSEMLHAPLLASSYEGKKMSSRMKTMIGYCAEISLFPCESRTGDRIIFSP